MLRTRFKHVVRSSLCSVRRLCPGLLPPHHHHHHHHHHYHHHHQLLLGRARHPSHLWCAQAIAEEAVANADVSEQDPDPLPQGLTELLSKLLAAGAGVIGKAKAN